MSQDTTIDQNPEATVKPSERAPGKFEAFTPDGSPVRAVTYTDKDGNTSEVAYAFRTEAEAKASLSE